MPHPSQHEGSQGSRGVKTHKVSYGSCDLSWSGLADCKVPKGPRSYWHRGPHVPDPGRVGRGTKILLLCQASLFLLYNQGAFDYSIFLFTENLNARGL